MSRIAIEASPFASQPRPEVAQTDLDFPRVAVPAGKAA